MRLKLSFAIGEITITLNDMSSLLHIHIVGGFYSYSYTSKEVVIALLMGLLGVDQKNASLETKQCKGGHVYVSWL